MSIRIFRKLSNGDFAKQKLIRLSRMRVVNVFSMWKLHRTKSAKNLIMQGVILISGYTFVNDFFANWNCTFHTIIIIIMYTTHAIEGETFWLHSNKHNKSFGTNRFSYTTDYYHVSRNIFNFKFISASFQTIKKR